MRNILYLASCILFLSCSGKEKENKQIKPGRKESKYKHLLSKYRKISFDTFKIYSPEPLIGGFEGTEIDSADALLFPTEIAQQHFNDPPGLFAIYKFAIDDNRVGLITRTPSEYIPSSIKLFFFDKAKDTITSYVELAETWGDAGDYMTKDSWLFKDRKKQLKAFMWILEGHDPVADDEQDTTRQEWNYYYLLDLSNGNADTINKDEKELAVKYGGLLR